jgi:plasmid maintenance system antidote protein VapI
LEISWQSLSEIVNKHHGVSPEMALRLARVFSTEAEMGLNMQKNMICGSREKEKETFKTVRNAVYTASCMILKTKILLISINKTK